MKHRLHTRLYYLDTCAFEYETAHLYEHLVIHSFTQQLRTHNLPLFLSGWVSGQTFREIMYIEAGFYSQAAAELFDTYMQSSERIDFSLVEPMLACVQAESYATATTLNQVALHKQLQQLDAKKFSLFDTVTPGYHPRITTPETTSTIITFAPAKKQFHNLTVWFGATNLSQDEKLALLRMTPPIRHVIDEVFVAMGAHQHGWGYTTDRPYDGLVDLSIYAIKKDHPTVCEIEQQLAKRLCELSSEIATHPNALQEYATIFRQESRWEDFPIQYFKWAGIVASRQHIAAALTPPTVLSLLKKLQFKVEPTTDEHWEYT